MLTPEELKEVPDSIVKIYQNLEDEIIKDITRRLEKTGEITGSADWQIYMLQNMGKDLKDIKKKIKDTTELSRKEVDKIFKEATNRSIEADNFLFVKAGKGILDIKNNPGILQFINANIKKTNNDLSNMTKSLGFKDRDRFKPIARFYQDTLNYAHFQVSSGAFTPQQAIKNAVKKIVDSGVRAIDYESGRSDRVDVAVRRAVLTSINQTTSYVSLMQMAELGGEYVEVTAHMGARPDHQTWQGKVYKVSDGLLRKIGGGNIDNDTQKGYNKGNTGNVSNTSEMSNIRKGCEERGIEYNPIQKSEVNRSISDIIDRISGGDLTEGSCASLSLAYVGNRSGFDVLDFRGGESQKFFSRSFHFLQLTKLEGVESFQEYNSNDFKAVGKLLKSVENNKEYILCTGGHSAIIRKVEKGFEYLELQSPETSENGFKTLNTYALDRRFGCKSTHRLGRYKTDALSYLIEAESLGQNEEFHKILGYINTHPDKQMKGEEGSVK